MTKKDQRDAGPKFAPMCAEKPKNSERAMTSRELKNLYYIKKEIEEQQRRIAELDIKPIQFLKTLLQIKV